MTDIQRSLVTSNLAQTRSGNMFNTLMEGLSEDNGETFAKYLGLSQNSSGITQSKYEIMIDSINARLKELRSTFDGLVQAVVEDGFITDIIGFGTTILAGLKNIVSAGDGVIGKIKGIGVALGALIAVLATMNAVGGPFSAILGLLAGGAVVGVSGL
jgi:hypothetical protein